MIETMVYINFIISRYVITTVSLDPFSKLELANNIEILVLLGKIKISKFPFLHTRRIEKVLRWVHIINVKIVMKIPVLTI